MLIALQTVKFQKISKKTGSGPDRTSPRECRSFPCSYEHVSCPRQPISWFRTPVPSREPSMTDQSDDLPPFADGDEIRRSQRERKTRRALELGAERWTGSEYVTAQVHGVRR